MDGGMYADIETVPYQVKQPIKFNKYQQPIPISSTAPKAKDVITVSGYGYAHEEPSGGRLKIGHTELITSAKCRQNYTVTDNMLCSSIELLDLCFGDSGGPAVYRGELVGVISQGCEYTAPNVFTKVANYHDWIRRVAGLDRENEKHYNSV
ncbi:kallikrein-11-like [Trichogramma pretiosum]|uniref:kallikrein-11-like n=1 Tax=Trichogramma pretiosum TaxID=7493 RepID=UPI0006C93C45|nr:kallikrein-11-like [Trichogramma pretiosum]